MLVRVSVVCLLLVRALSAHGQGAVDTVQTLHAFDMPPAEPHGLVQGADGGMYGVTRLGGDRGVIYRASLAGGAPVVVHRFQSGRAPDSTLLRGADGALYGTTMGGGIDDRGTVFRFDPATGRLRTLHAFVSPSEPWGPIGPLMQASDGRLYGIAAHGGDVGSIFAIDPDTGRTEFLHTFGAMDGHGDSPVGGLVQASNGWIYGVMEEGGPVGGSHGTIYRIDPSSHAVEVVHAFSTLDAWAPLAGLVRGSDDALYGTTSNGGPDGAGAVFRLVPATGSVQILHHFRPSNGVDGAEPAARLVEAADGALWGTTTSGHLAVGGVVFRLARLPGGGFAHATMATLDADAHGTNPTPGLALANDGWLYGTTTAGGPGQAGTIYRVDSLLRGAPGNAAQLAIRHAFSLNGSAWDPSFPPVPFGDGYFYGTTGAGGALGDGVVYRLHPTMGVVTVIGDIPVGTAVHGDTAWNSDLVDAGNGSLYAIVVSSFATTAWIVRVTPATGSVTAVLQYTGAGTPPRARGLVRVGSALYGLLETQAGMGVFRYLPASNTLSTVAPITTRIDLSGSLTARADGRLYVTTTTPSFFFEGALRHTAVLHEVDPATGSVVAVATARSQIGRVAPAVAADGAIAFAAEDRLVSYQPGTGLVVTGCNVVGPGSIRSISASPDGAVYVGVEAHGGTVVHRCAGSEGALAAVMETPGVMSELRPSGGALYGAMSASAGGAGTLFRIEGAEVDADLDGLGDDWERAWGLDPASASGVNGAFGDPDGDGMSNAVEKLNGLHPKALVKRYLAEGAANAFFDTRIAIANPGVDPAHVQIKFQDRRGFEVRSALAVPGLSTRTVTSALPRAYGWDSFATVVESDRLVTVDRTMRWDATGYGSHAERAVEGPSTTWYFAEGSTSGDFSLFYLLQNPNPSTVTATVRYLRPSGLPPITRTYTLPGRSRTTLAVDGEAPELAVTDVSAVVTATAPIIAERAMYATRGGQTFAAGHGSAGVVAPALEWFLAEGATGPFFDLFVLIANPNPTAAAVSVDYLLPGGGVLTKAYTVPADGRFTIWVDDERLPAGSDVRPLANAAVSTTVRSTNGVPIIVERTMWWPGPESAATYWYEAHNSPGATAPATSWSIAGAEVGGSDGTETYVLIANTGATAGQVRVRLFFENGNSTGRTYQVPAKSRTTVPVGAHFPEAAANGRMAVLVESLGASPAPIVVERATYANPGGLVWASGTNALATPVP